ncbi:MAG: hypothetical protein H6832_00755 [Planctomycetes bacterium]|nr:hypothetical protein [Planctomycetota bacterium]MCB9916913.1 hypothetical protein [Planctomycetota bacterium]
MRRFASFLALCIVALPAIGLAQGGSRSAGLYGRGIPGTGGFVPEVWIDGHPSLNNAQFKITLERGVGGANALLFLSAASADIPFFNFRLLVDPLTSFGPFVTTLGGGVGVGGAGNGNLTLPVPNDSGLLGASLFFQWLVIDSASTSGLVASNGLRATLSSGPLVFAGGTSLVEFVPGSGSTTMGPSANNVVDMHFDRTGTLALVAAANAVVIYDMTSKPRRVLASVTTASTVNCLAIHPNQARAYVVLPHRTSPKIEILDTQRSSATFGTLIGSVGMLPSSGLGDMEGCSISDDGRRLAVAVMGLIGNKGVLVIDVEPGSSTRDQYLKAIPVTIGSFVTDVALSADGTTAYVCSGNLGPGSLVGMIDLTTGQLKNMASAGDFSVDIDIDPRGRFLVVANPNSKNLTHVDLRAGSNFFVASPFPVTNSRFFSVALTPDGSQAIAVGNGSSTADIYAFDTASLRVVWSVTNTMSAAAIAVR